jgi:hypothetical protein
MFKLNNEGTFALKAGTGEWHNVKTSQAYIAWLAEGNTPEPADIPPAPTPPTKAERIRALEQQAADAQAKVTRQALLALALEKACADPAAQGLTQSQVHDFLMTQDNGYRALYTVEQEVQAIRAE